ncbi:Cytochrome b2 [Colletotrichum trifolii]|uniref:Cytochrome b2 n=1 Tax=Colletotrichum trifolii TaxID=5466 RepID=A0A4R8RSE0_COLTR|nr:Cytochrome b2 [Colletotrichum trifolii]
MVLSGTEVAKNNTKDSCWVVIHGQVWNVTDFLDEHPGGAKLIFNCAGCDATEAYDSIHNPDLIAETLSPDCCLGPIDAASTVPRTAESPWSTSPAPANRKPAFPRLGAVLNADDFEKVARAYLSETGWAYYSSGAEDELSLGDARRIFRKLALRPRVLRAVDSVSTSTSLLGLALLAAAARYAHPEAETVLARAAGREGILYCVPTRPSASLESIFASRATTPGQPLCFQLYVDRDRQKAQRTIRRAEKLGAAAIFVTVDSPVIGKRERDERLTVSDDDDEDEPRLSEPVGVVKSTASGLLNAGLTWADLAWIRATTALPLVVKGVQSVEDALLAYEHGARAVVLSNHGGRSMDTAQAPVLTLLEIRRYAPRLLSPETRSGFQVFVDGGIRRGTDVIKALALGASGRGRRQAVPTNMALAGAASVRDIVPEMVNSERAEREVTRRVKL